jgi:hypothetical protein
MIKEKKQKEKKEKKEKREIARGLFLGQTLSGVCATLGFPQLLGAIKRCFKVLSLTFMYILCVGSYLAG